MSTQFFILILLIDNLSHTQNDIKFNSNSVEYP